MMRGLYALEEEAAASAHRRYFNVADGSVSHATLAQYNVISWERLKEKVTQFPKGTTFTWSSDSPGTEAEERAFNELKDYLERAGLKLTR